MDPKALAQSILVGMICEFQGTEVRIDKLRELHGSRVADVSWLQPDGARNGDTVLVADLKTKKTPPQVLADSIFEMLMNGLHQMHANTTGDDAHAECWSKENVAALLRERSNNLAMAMPEMVVDAATKQTEEEAKAQIAHFTNRAINRWAGNVPHAKITEDDIGASFDRVNRLMQADNSVRAAIAAEGTPAVKDTFGAFLKASDELLELAEKFQRLAGDELQAWRKLVKP